LVPPDSARSPALRPDRKSRRWLLFCCSRMVSLVHCAVIRIRVSASTTVDFGPVFSGQLLWPADFRYRYLRRHVSFRRCYWTRSLKRLTFVADTGAGVSSTFVAITEALVHAENAIVEGVSRSRSRLPRLATY
jgi:hypothetical protein